ncbi:MAG: SusD/RagB family nutrient-binding outer membrane lipoprotein [Bacteroidetes bacterium]|nr:SusD/RagB family nutrient-binding outer membrane lipoprotein [Bacteroidota bacterium]
MKLNIKIVTALFSLLVLGSCQDFDELVKNPNLPTSVPPSLLLTGALNRMNDQNAWDGKQGSMSAAQFYLSTYDYYGTNNYDQEPFTNTKNNFEYTTVLENLVRMDIEAKNAGKPDLNPYSAIGKFLKAYYFHLMSQKLGDIPVSEALLAEKNTAPKYDSQKEVYKQVLALLEASNTDLGKLIANNDGTLQGDIYLGNDLRKWQKIVNSFTLRVLISLSKKEADTDLNIKQKFSSIVNDPAKYPVMSGNVDNLQYAFNAAYNPYPKNPTSLGRDGTRENVGSVYLGLTSSLNDPRTFVAATPAPRQLENNILKITSGGTTEATVTFKKKQAHDLKVGQTVKISADGLSPIPADYLTNNAIILSVPTDTTFTYAVPAGLADVSYKIVDKAFVPVAKSNKSYTDFTAYIGAEAGASMSSLGTDAQGGRFSYINALRYSFDFGGTKAESAIIIGYPELCFNIAEGINRGWAAGNAGTWYTNGIKASMAFLGLADGSSIPVGNLTGTTTYGTISVSVTNYLAQPSVQYQGGSAGLTQILNQKYIAFWQNSNWEAFFNQRRTGVPVFSEGVGNGNGNKIAKRWQYPRAEADANSVNYNAAVASQYGKDDLGGVMWILQ